MSKLNDTILAIVGLSEVNDKVKLAAIAVLVGCNAPAPAVEDINGFNDVVRRASTEFWASEDGQAEKAALKKRASRKKAPAPAEPVAMAAPEAPSVPVAPVAVVAPAPAEPEFKLLGLAATVEKRQHTKTGVDIWVVKVTDAIRDYKAYSERVRAMGGYYYKPLHGFVFKADPRVK